MSKPLILVIIFLFFLTGCSPFGGNEDPRKLVASGLSPKELYDLAKVKANAGSIDQAIEKFELILVSYPASKFAIQARLDIAYQLFKRKKYNRAILELDKFIQKYPCFLQI